MKKTTLSLKISEETTFVLNGMELKMLPDGNREYEVEIGLTPLPVVEIRPPMPERARPVEASLRATPSDVPEEDFWDDFEEERREEAPHSAEEEVARRLEELLQIVSGSELARLRAAQMLAELLEPEQGDAEEDDEDEPDDDSSGQEEDQGPYVPNWL